MDTGKLLLRQLSYALRMCRTAEERQQVTWWTARVNEMKGEQPSAEPPAGQLEFVEKVTPFPAPLPEAAGFARRDEDPGESNAGGDR